MLKSDDWGTRETVGFFFSFNSHSEPYRKQSRAVETKNLKPHIQFKSRARKLPCSLRQTFKAQRFLLHMPDSPTCVVIVAPCVTTMYVGERRTLNQIPMTVLRWWQD